ncbi:MAG: amino acid ABC transporter substrate-binding protein [Deltaproteobacteria bacterium]|nr:amino acid ABC transporter substrate-binding protein [Deltaproteobacteria bacterium]
MGKQKWIWGLTAGVALTAILLVLFVLRPWEKEKILIGAIISMSGPASHLVAVKDGMQMAISEVNSWGGINGREVELIVRDSKSDPAEGIRAFENIEKKNRPLFYVATNSSIAMGLAPLAEENEAVIAGLVVSASEFTQQNPWCYKYYTMPEDEARGILFILELLKVHKLGILYQDEEYGISVFSILKKGFEASGGTTIGVSFPVKNPDWQDEIGIIRDTEAVFVVGFVKNEEKAILALKEAKYPGHILGASGVTNLVSSPEMDGVYVVAPLIYNRNFLFAREVKENFDARYEKALTHQAASGYDFVKLLAGLLEGREMTREGLRKLLAAGFIYPGIFGEIEVEAGTRDIIIPLHPARIVEGKIEFLK